MKKRFRLPKTDILRGYGAFSEVLSRRVFLQASEIRCFYIFRKEIPSCLCRVGFAISRERRAVKRNAARRLMRESYRLQKETLLEACHSFKVSVDCVFMYKGRLTGHDMSFLSVNTAMSRIIEMMVDQITQECVKS